MLTQILGEAVKSAIGEVRDLGKSGKVNIVVGDKRACVAESASRDAVLKVLDSRIGEDYCLITEGFPDKGNKNSQLIVTCDPIDGTLYYVRQRSGTIPVTIALSARKGNKFRDINAGAIGNIYTEEIFTADSSCAVSSACGPLKSEGNEEHEPLIFFDFYFPANAKARLGLRNPRNPAWDRFESLNTGSVAEMMCRVASGEADAFVNLGGPSMYEMAAAYPIIRSSGAYALSPVDGRDLGELEVAQGRIPVIVGKNEGLARKILKEIRSQNP